MVALSEVQVYSLPRARGEEGRSALLVHCTEDRLMCVDSSLAVTTWAWSNLPNGTGQPFTLTNRRTCHIPARALHMSTKPFHRPALSRGRDHQPAPGPGGAGGGRLGRSPSGARGAGAWVSGLATSLGQVSLRQVSLRNVSFGGVESNDRAGPLFADGDDKEEFSPQPVGVAHSCVALRKGRDGDVDRIITCGYWDHAIRCDLLDASSKLSAGPTGTGGHVGAITCLCMGGGGSLLMTGGDDGTCRVWVVGNAPMASALRGMGATCSASSGGGDGNDMVCVHVLYGHEAPIASLAVSEVSRIKNGRSTQ